jgi:valyl-tRNA synthetase
LDVKAARVKTVKKLDEAGLLENEKTVEKSVGHAERTNAIVEHLPKKQWFINVTKEFTLEDSKIDEIEDGENTTLKKIMAQVIESGQIDITPERFEKNYFNWIDDLRDWCISRQIWYGHRIPVFYCQDETHSACTEPIVSTQEINECPHCGGSVRQDEDTLDTWFSSGLWTFSVLGWPKDTKDLKDFHPTDVLETGSDILFFWVARMVLMSGFLLGDVPFDNVYLHGMVVDGDGRKMSKSLGNGIDPKKATEKHGADALRMALVDGTTPGNNSSVSEEKIEKFSKFANKLWNASKFVLMNLPEDYSHQKPDSLLAKDRTRLQRLDEFKEEISDHIEKFQFNLAADKLYEYTWHTFADDIIEDTKDPIYNDEADDTAEASAIYTLYEVLTTSYKLLHPFMPHITETLWQELPTTEEPLATTRFPEK